MDTKPLSWDEVRTTDRARTHLAVASQIDVSLDFGEGCHVVCNVVHLGRLKRTMARVPRRAGIRRRLRFLARGGREVGPLLPLMAL